MLLLLRPMMRLLLERIITSYQFSESLSPSVHHCMCVCLCVQASGFLTKLLLDALCISARSNSLYQWRAPDCNMIEQLLHFLSHQIHPLFGQWTEGGSGWAYLEKLDIFKIHRKLFKWRGLMTVIEFRMLAVQPLGEKIEKGKGCRGLLWLRVFWQC